MIRFIDLRTQITFDSDPCFAFYDTVKDQFLCPAGFIFDSIDDFEEAAKLVDWDRDFINRCKSLVPADYFSAKLDDEVINLPAKHLQTTDSFARLGMTPNSQKISELVPELARDAAASLLKAIGDIVRYRKQDVVSSCHALTRIMINDTPSVVVISATVIPLEHLDIYGQPFADDISKVCAQMDAHNEKQGHTRRRCDCENNLCSHVAGDCKKPAGDTITIFESRLCDDCAQVMPKEYVKGKY